MKANTTFIKIGSLLFFLIFCMPISSYSADITLKLAHVAPNGSVYDVAAQKLAERVSENTSGRVAIKLFGNSQLGNPFELWAQLKSGAVDIHIMDVGAVNMVEAAPKNFSVTTAPYLFSTQESFHAFLHSDLFKSMMAKVEASQNMTYLGYLGDAIPRGFSTTKKKAATPEDMKGLKLRVPQIPIFISIYKAWGATPTPVSPAEVYTGLKTGLIEGMDNNLVDIYLAGYYEIQKYYHAIDYLRSGTGGWINTDKWLGLSDDIKKAVAHAVLETAEYMNQYTAGQIRAAEKGYLEAGVEIVRPDLAPWKAIAEKLNEKSDGKIWEKGLYDKVKNLQ